MSDQIRSMFSRISRRYDLANTLLSFGAHHRWRMKSVRLAAPKKDARVLDLACGTGDFAIEFAKAIGDQGHVVAGDFSEEMLRLAEKKASKYNISFVVADAMNLQFDDESFDVCSIAFGIRNVDDPVVALYEMKRVLKGKGKIVVLEFGQTSGFFGKLFRLYSNHVIPLIGSFVTRDRNAYKYLQESSMKFPCGDAFALMLNNAGFKNVIQKKLLFGVVYIYVGDKNI